MFRWTRYALMWGNLVQRPVSKIYISFSGNGVHLHVQCSFWCVQCSQTNNYIHLVIGCNGTPDRLSLTLYDNEWRKRCASKCNLFNSTWIPNGFGSMVHWTIYVCMALQWTPLLTKYPNIGLHLIAFCRMWKHNRTHKMESKLWHGVRKQNYDSSSKQINSSQIKSGFVVRFNVFDTKDVSKYCGRRWFDGNLVCDAIVAHHIWESSVGFLFFVQHIFALVMVWLFCVKELGSFPANRTTKCTSTSTTFVYTECQSTATLTQFIGWIRSKNNNRNCAVFALRKQWTLNDVGDGDVCIHPTRHTSAHPHSGALFCMHTINLLACVTVAVADMELRSIRTRSTRLRCGAVFAMSLASAWTKRNSGKKKKMW